MRFRYDPARCSRFFAALLAISITPTLSAQSFIPDMPLVHPPTSPLPTGHLALVAGPHAQAPGHFGVALGPFAQAHARNCVALGFGSACTQENTVSVGRRRIEGVEDGVAPSDAVTLGQLRAVESRFKRMDALSAISSAHASLAASLIHADRGHGAWGIGLGGAGDRAALAIGYGQRIELEGGRKVS